MKSEYINHIRKTEVSLEELSKMEIFCFREKPIDSYSGKELLSTYLSSCLETINDSYINIRIEDGHLKYDEDCNHKQFQNNHIFLRNEPFYVSNRRESIEAKTVKSEPIKDCINYKFTYSQIKDFIIDLNQNKEDIVKSLCDENYLDFKKCFNIVIDKENYLETTLLFDYIIEPIEYEKYLIQVGIRSSEYDYDDDILYNNIDYFKKCYREGMGAYKALLFLKDVI